MITRRRLSDLDAAEFDAYTAQLDHRMVMRTAGRISGRRRLTPDETVAMFRRHVVNCPTCPTCAAAIARPAPEMARAS